VPDLESLYARLPLPLQHVAVSLEGARIQAARFGRGFGPVQKAVSARDDISPDAAAELRDARLRAFVVHAATTVPFYEELFRSLRIDPREIQSLSDLAALPILTKAQIQERPEAFLSRVVPERARLMVHTSGTTGAGLRFPTTIGAVREQWAVWRRYWLRFGIEPGTRCGYFVGRSIVPLKQDTPPFWRYNLPQRRVLFSAYHMSPENLGTYVAELKRRRLPWLHGYPSTLSLVAAHIVDRQIDLGYPLRWVTTSAENLLPHQVELMTRAFGVRPRQHYGMAEAVANFSECEAGRLHVDEDFAAVEFVKRDEGPNEPTLIIGTNFSNPATPMLRFDVRDTVTVGAAVSCECGRPGRVVGAVDGRKEDYVVLTDGTKIGRLDHVFKDMVNVHEAQIRQSSPGEFDILIVRSNRYTSKDEEDLLRELRKRIGEEAAVGVEYVERLPRESSGKSRFVVSDVAAG
jgi:phenylacetate-CoA ligase